MFLVTNISSLLNTKMRFQPMRLDSLDSYPTSILPNRQRTCNNMLSYYKVCEFFMRHVQHQMQVRQTEHKNTISRRYELIQWTCKAPLRDHHLEALPAQPEKSRSSVCNDFQLTTHRLEQPFLKERHINSLLHYITFVKGCLYKTTRLSKGSSAG